MYVATTSLLSGFSGSSVLRETHESEVRQNVCNYNVSLVRLQWIVRTEGNTRVGGEAECM